MIAAIKQFFAAIFTLFSAAEKFASAVNEVAIWTEEEARGMRLEGAKEREANIKALEAKLAAQKQNKSTGTTET